MTAEPLAPPLPVPSGLMSMATARPRYQLGGRILVNDRDLRMPTVATCLGRVVNRGSMGSVTHHHHRRQEKGLGEPFSYFVVVVGLVGHGWDGPLALPVAAHASSGPPPTSWARSAAAEPQTDCRSWRRSDG